MQYYKVLDNTANYQSSEYTKSYQSRKDFFFRLMYFRISNVKKTENLKIKKMGSEKYYNLVPSIGGSFGFGWKKMFEKAFLPLLLIVIIAGLLNGPVGASWKADDNFGWHLFMMFPVILFGLAYKFMFMPIIDFGEKFFGSSKP